MTSLTAYCLHVRDVVLVSLLITNFTPCSSVSIGNFEQANAGWGKYLRHKGFIKGFASTHIFPRICVMHLTVVIYSLFFCKFYFLSMWKREETIKLKLEEFHSTANYTTKYLSRQFLANPLNTRHNCHIAFSSTPALAVFQS